MSTIGQPQKKRSFFREPAPAVTEPLWKKISDNSKDNPLSTQSSKDTGSSQKQDANVKKQANINMFLQKLHHKISESINQSESEIMEKMNIDWVEDTTN